MGFLFLKNEQLLALKVIQIWWEKTQDGVQVQTWTQVVTHDFFLLEK
jgi:hypothetical protein